MRPPKISSTATPGPLGSVLREEHIESGFIVSNRTNTYYFANNNAHHFTSNADERFLPTYQFSDEKNKKII